ncbi:MFS transporter [Wenjunlia vitaminophila]|uniref:MFS transporter n=1 Tax=Wenjunlia vitaminophila TaxID=76728 RepID=A0A0T6LYZ9_WENVI|nr:MFS transporter [Wenjunlia vitaminophila]KRV51342.1 MFS transporter [Wenjunlia vitaminophila]
MSREQSAGGTRPHPRPTVGPGADGQRPSGSGSGAGAGVRLGLRANLAQFTLLVAVNALVGGLLGQERTVLPLLAGEVFGLSAHTAALTFIVAFGAAKAVTNVFAGAWADRFGRRPVLIAGWLVALPVPAMLAWGPSWGWIVAANVLLGVNQGLAWSTTVIMKIDLAGPARRGLAMGLNEAAGYLAVAVSAMATGALADAYGLRPAPFLLGAAYTALALGLSTVAVRETHGHARAEAARHPAPAGTGPRACLINPAWFVTPGTHARCVVGIVHVRPVRGRPSALRSHAPDAATPALRADGATYQTAPSAGALSTRQVVHRVSLGDPTLSAASWAGLVNNLNDALAWGVFPLLFAAHGLGVAEISGLAALYPAVWGAGQMLTGWWSDHVGRKHLITAGMFVQAAAIALVAATTAFPAWALAQVLLGLGTALVYPTLIAAIGDVAHPAWRARAVGVYRLWRDGGFAVGALAAGALADAWGLTTAIWAVAALTAAAGVLVAVRMEETRVPETAGPGGRRGRRTRRHPRR